jgi:hypothetical protein
VDHGRGRLLELTGVLAAWCYMLGKLTVGAETWRGEQRGSHRGLSQVARCLSVAGDEGVKVVVIFFHGQLVRSRTERSGAWQSDVGEDGKVATPFVGSGRRGGGQSGGKAATSNGFSIRPLWR